VARPHEGSGNYAGLAAALAAAVFTAWSYVSIRRLVSTESPEQIVFWSSLTWVGLAAIPVVPVWVEPPLRTWPWLILAGLAGTTGHLLWARALRLGSVSRIAPLSFLQLPLTSALGYLYLRERLDALAIAGGAIIVAANLWAMRFRPSAPAAEADSEPASFKPTRRGR
jgi:drug/metabolite transporter (DMT)-like permease